MSSSQSSCSTSCRFDLINAHFCSGDNSVAAMLRQLYVWDWIGIEMAWARIYSSRIVTVIHESMDELMDEHWVIWWDALLFTIFFDNQHAPTPTHLYVSSLNQSLAESSTLLHLTITIKSRHQKIEVNRIKLSRDREQCIWETWLGMPDREIQFIWCISLLADLRRCSLPWWIHSTNLEMLNNCISKTTNKYFSTRWQRQHHHDGGIPSSCVAPSVAVNHLTLSLANNSAPGLVLLMISISSRVPALMILIPSIPPKASPYLKTVLPVDIVSKSQQRHEGHIPQSPPVIG